MLDLVVSYCEVVDENSSQTYLAKSPNKHNGIYFIVDPMFDEICKGTEDGKLEPKAEVKEWS